MWPFIYFVIFGILLSRVAADCDCASLESLDSCALNAACIVGRDPTVTLFELQLMLKPEFQLPPRQRLANSYSAADFIPPACNITCKWNTLLKTCSNLPLGAPTNDSSYIYSFTEGEQPEESRFDLYQRMTASLPCENPSGTACSN
jgi:hypothetical protein